MASSPEISCSADNVVDSGICRYVGADFLDMVCHYADRVLRFSLCNREVMTMKNTRCCPKCNSDKDQRELREKETALSNYSRVFVMLF